MIPEKLTIHEIFSRERQFTVPLFQRSYIWNLENQWEPLWEDIIGRAEAHLVKNKLKTEGKISSHFLGAIVLNVKSVVGRLVAKSDVIDGQQRLTTLQIFLGALRDQSKKLGASDKDVKLLIRLTQNPDCEEDSEEQFKVWPTNADRKVYLKLMKLKENPDVESDFQINSGGLPRMVQAYLYFSQMIEEYIKSEDHKENVEERFFSLVMALKQSLQIIVIELEEGDDPQIIFETLNARGQPLLPSDLIRNMVFMQVDSSKAEKLYNKYWKHFDDERVENSDETGENRFWHMEARQGRLNRPRIDLFIFHYLTMKTEGDIRIGELFKEFKKWKSGNKISNEAFLKDLQSHCEHFRKLIDPKGNSRLEVFAKRLLSLDTSTIYPLLLYLSSVEGKHIEKEDLDQCICDLESFMIRRFVCALTPKNYNRFFLSMLSKVKRAAAKNKCIKTIIREELLRSQEHTAVWPTNQKFLEGWLDTPLYVSSRPDRVGMILRALGMAMTTSKNEKLNLQGDITVEHLLPQKGSIKDYPFGDVEIPEGYDQESYRKRIINTIGNLTLLTGANNSAASNLKFSKKVKKIIEDSDMRINAWLRTDPPTKWDEVDILKRSNELLKYSLKIWPKPKA